MARLCKTNGARNRISRLSLGIRWDDYGNPHPDLSKTPPEGNVFRGQGNDLNTQFANAYVRQVKATYNGRLNTNWSPRIGFAYNPDGNGKTLIKAALASITTGFLWERTIGSAKIRPAWSRPPFAWVIRYRPYSVLGPAMSTVRFPIPHDSGRTVGCQGWDRRITSFSGRN